MDDALSNWNLLKWFLQVFNLNLSILTGQKKKKKKNLTVGKALSLHHGNGIKELHQSGT